MHNATDIPTTEPRELTVGETWKWKKSLDHYAASAGWVLTYTLINATAKITIAAAADGDDHSVDVDEAATAGYTAGTYRWQAAVANGTDRFVIDRGEIVVKPDFAAAATYDSRSHARKTLDAIEAVLETRATREDLSYTIGDRQLSRIPNSELLVFRDRYKAEVAREENAERLAKGLAPKNRLLVRI